MTIWANDIIIHQPKLFGHFGFLGIPLKNHIKVRWAEVFIVYLDTYDLRVHLKKMWLPFSP